MSTTTNAAEQRIEALETLTVLSARLLVFLAGCGCFNANNREDREISAITTQMNALIHTLQESDR